MRFLCFGVGAIGAYIGGSLALAGHEVAFLERPQTAGMVASHGIRLQSGEEIRVVSSPEIYTSLETALAARAYDAALLAVKSFDTAELAASLKPLADQIPPIVCLQNGVENEPLLAATLGPGRVIPATVTTAVGRRTAGSVSVERLRGVGIWSGHPLSANLIAAFAGAGLRPKGCAQAEGMKWSKMLTNLIANASSAILDLPPSSIFAHPGLFRLEMQMLNEALQVMQAFSYPVMDLPGTPVRALAFAARYLPTALSRPLMANALGKGRGGKMPSFHIDLHQGRGQSEVDYLNGAVVRFAGRQGIPAPVNTFLTQTLMDLTSGKIPMDTFASNPDKFLKACS